VGFILKGFTLKGFILIPPLAGEGHPATTATVLYAHSEECGYKTSPPFIPPLHKCGERFTLKGIGGEINTL
jgi:hypothetical protein